jgi:SWI/SNF-related matrix-associated actin-dependent regulator 1 of chromatin subfamily A
LIDINKIKGVSALNKLKTYEGNNPYIKMLKTKLLNKGKLVLTSNQHDYILRNFELDPIKINKIVSITEYLGNELQKQFQLKFVPEKILIEYILDDSEKTYHVSGKLKRNQTNSELFFIPKTQLLDDPYFEEIDVEVDFDKYEKLDTFKHINGNVGRKILDLQKIGIKFLLSKKGAILADEMGSGKSLQATVAALESGAKKILIVCPSSVKINWQREINYFQEYDIAIINGRRWENAKFTIINYDILKNFHTVKTDENKDDYDFIENQHLLKSKFDLCIIDEAHNLKNKDSIRGSIMTDLCQNIETVWLLSGTPVANRPMDYYNLLKLIKSPLTNDWKFYVKRYCDGKQITTRLKNGRTKKVWLTNGASNLEELSNKTRNIFLRRLTTEFTDMPERNVIPLIHNLNDNQRIEYDQLWEDYILERQRNKKTVNIQRDLVELGLLRKYMAMETIPYTIDIVNEIIEQGNKVVVFTCFTEELLELANYYGSRCVCHYGQMSEKDKQKSIDEFQNREDGPMVFIGNIISAGVGITLTRAHYLVFNSFDWVPGNAEQAEFRCFRINQKNNVQIYYNLFNNTIIEKMWHTLNYKKEIINQIIGGKTLNDKEITELIIDEIIKENEKS